MNRPASTPATRRILALRARAITQRRVRPRRRWQRGQTLIMFALSVTMLVGLAGLAIDVVRAYDLYAREHRAAEAGALAGVLWMPCFYNSTASSSNCSTGTSPNLQTAQTTALAEVLKNGFGQGTALPMTCTDADTSQPVTICQRSTSQTALEVTVTQPINVFFLSVLGIQSFDVSASAAADYLSPFILSQGNPSVNANVWGCGGVPSGNPKCALAAINGPAEFKEQGDPFVYCQEGVHEGQVNGGPPADTPFPGPYPEIDSVTNTIGGTTTNVLPAASPGCGGSNQDHQVGGFGGTQGTASTLLDVYDFYIKSTVPNQTIYIWNPGFSPSDKYSSCQGSVTNTIGEEFFQDLGCSNYYTQYGLPDRSRAPIVFNGTNFDDPRMYFNMTYTVYPVSPLFTLSQTPVAGTPVTYAPADHMTADVTAHGCVNSYMLDGASAYGIGSGRGTCDGDSAWYQNWVPLVTLPTVGGYRLSVEATTFHPTDGCDPFTCGWGRHVYSMAICAAGTAPSNVGANLGSGCSTGATPPTPPTFISPWNNADIYLNFPSGKSGAGLQVPIAWIDSTFAGHSVTFSVFNPGVTHGKAPNSYFTIVPPDCTPVTFTQTSDPNWLRVTSSPGLPSNLNCASVANWQWVQSAARGSGGQVPGDFIYHGMWVQVTVNIPTGYKGGQWYWDQIVGPGAKDFGQICLSVSVAGGSPVHLIL